MALLMSMAASPRYLIILPAALYIATYVINIPGLNSGTVLLLLYLVVGSGMFAGILLTPVIYKKLGYKTTCVIAAVTGGVSLTAAFLLGKINIYFALPFMTIGGLSLGSYNVLPYPMVGDSLDYLEWKTGREWRACAFRSTPSSLNSTMQ